MTAVIVSMKHSKDLACMIKQINKSTLKSKVLEACIKKQQLLIDDFKQRIKTLLEPRGVGNEEEYDNTSLSQQGQASDEISGLNEALSLAMEELKILHQLKAKEDTRNMLVGPGAIVITDKAKFYISVSIEQVNVDGETFIGISTQSPLYQIMKGLFAGGIFEHKGITYHITDIF